MEFPDEEPCEEDRPSYEAEKEKALKDVRSQIAHTALLAAQQLTQQQLNAASAEKLVEQVLNDISSRA